MYCILEWSSYAFPSLFLLGRFTEGITLDGGLLPRDLPEGEGGGEIIRLPLPRDLGKIFNITLGEARLVKQEKSDTFRRVMSKKGHQSSRKKLE